MHWAMTHDPGEPQPETRAWIAKHRLPEDLRNRDTGNANASNTRTAPGSGSPLWENNFRKLHGEMMKVAQRYPGLAREITSVLQEMNKPELWN